MWACVCMFYVFFSTSPNGATIDGLCIYLKSSMWRKYTHTRHIRTFETMFANKNKWFDMHPYPFQIRTMNMVEWHRHSLFDDCFCFACSFIRSPAQFQRRNILFSHTRFYLFEIFFFHLTFSSFLMVFWFVHSCCWCCCCYVVFFCTGIRYFLYWHWCLKNVNKPRKATFQRRRRRHLHRAQMEHQMVNRIRLRKIFKHSSKCWKKKIGHS